VRGADRGHAVQRAQSRGAPPTPAPKEDLGATVDKEDLGMTVKVPKLELSPAALARYRQPSRRRRE
jgi:hypothetical protein